MTSILSAYDKARQAFWSQENLPAIGQRLALVNAGGALGTQTWTETGDPFACRVSPVSIGAHERMQAFSLNQRVLWHVVAAETEAFDASHRIRLTVELPSGDKTFDVEILQPRVGSSDTESRLVTRGPV